MDDSLQARLCAVLEADPVPEVRSEAARALSVAGGSREQAIVPLVRALDDSNHGVRRAATLALARIPDPRVAEALMDTLRTRPELWEEASAALASAGDRGLIARLLPLLDSESSQIRRGALRSIAALSRTREIDDSQPLFVYTDDEGHRHPLF
jgi:HEAT repeat protein